MGSARFLRPAGWSSNNQLKRYAAVAVGERARNAARRLARGDRVQRARLGWRQQDLADRLGWERPSVGHMETGRRALRVPDLARALRMTMTDFVRGADPDDLRALGL
jgi:DNA-binding XRE family transcriptional regulator